MSEFSSMLTDHLKTRGIMLRAAAEACGINYTLMSRYTSGNRLPPNLDAVKDMADALQMSKAEKDQLCDLFFVTRLGPSTREAFDRISHLLASLDSLFAPDDSPFPQVSYQKAEALSVPIMPLSSGTELLEALSYMLYREADQDSIPVRMIMQPNSQISEGLINHPLNPKLHLSQIVCIDPNHDSASHVNLDVIRGLLPIACSRFQSEIYYGYEPVQNAEEGFDLFPCTLITDSHVLRFDVNLTHGEIIGIPDVVKLYSDQFDVQKEHAMLLTHRMPGMEAHIENVIKNENRDAITYAIHSWPCIGPFLSRDIYEKQISHNLPNREAAIELLCSNYNDYDQQEEDVALLTSILSKSGIRDFLDHGILREFPIIYHDPFPMEMRIRIIERTIETLRHKPESYKFYIAKDDFKIPEKVGLVFSNGLLSIKDSYSPGIDTLFLQEQHFVRLLMDYFEYCVSTKRVYTVEETIEILEQFLAEVKS